ncbi:hypothetical protein, partial [Streptomyces microflavus]|uniref:hypothetical protein n=1 Tax=Streptomyces microflavus TaxID=1919 RepID=UPI003F4C5137
MFGAGTVAESAPYHWRDGGSLPRSPLPMMAAYVPHRPSPRRRRSGNRRPGRRPGSPVRSYAATQAR